MVVTRAHGVDISSWQTAYSDDGIDEGFPLDFIIQKAAHGTYDYSDPANDFYGRYWKAQRDSIEEFVRKLFYQWFETEQAPDSQAKVAIKVMDRDKEAFEKPYLKIVVDFEAYQNTISKDTAFKLKDYIEYVWANSDYGLVIYCNYWIYVLLLSWLGQEFMDKVDFWFAGGIYYNQERTEPISDDITPVLPGQSKKWVLWQYSADGNKLADELDFGTKESTSIDLDVFNGTPEEMDVWLGLAEEPEPEPTDPICDHTAMIEDAKDAENTIQRLIQKLEG